MVEDAWFTKSRVKRLGGVLEDRLEKSWESPVDTPPHATISTPPSIYRVDHSDGLLGRKRLKILIIPPSCIFTPS